MAASESDIEADFIEAVKTVTGKSSEYVPPAPQINPFSDYIKALEKLFTVEGVDEEITKTEIGKHVSPIVPLFAGLTMYCQDPMPIFNKRIRQHMKELTLCNGKIPCCECKSPACRVVRIPIGESWIKKTFLYAISSDRKSRKEFVKALQSAMKMQMQATEEESEKFIGKHFKHE